MDALKNELLTEADTRIEILYLSEDDMVEAGVLDAGRCVDVMEETIGLLEDGDVLMGGPKHDEHGCMLWFPKESEIPNFPLNDSRDRRFIAMPAYVGGRFHLAGMKWYGSNGRNREKGMPRSILMACLNDVETGAPLCYMSANLLSAMRTGAMPGLAAMKLANPDAKVLTLLGPGNIQRCSVLAILAKMQEIDTVRIKGSSATSASTQKMKAFVEAHCPQIKHIVCCDTMEEAIVGADIISEAVSCGEGEWPEVKAKWLKPGCTYIVTSTFNMEYESIKSFKKVVDNIGMYDNYAAEDHVGYLSDGSREHTGVMGEDFVLMAEDGIISRDSIIQLGEIIRGKKPGRESKEEIILVSIEGMPIEDVSWGYECYHTALEKGIGTKLKLWDAPRSC